ncbi:hypothetical protein LFAB_16870 [Lactiplantibacillus fabifermentans T30PCM01]|uniref:Uncharacterized protein n=1 Tax=Lactiplantibacillus fabifermentans T30PCM01 TaxID=1400520 RepID=W6T3X9_9LACO|nr:hypothetical protein LFAB_16870 [Lactiplantibacillus fabifermentans T30PCM01]
MVTAPDLVVMKQKRRQSTFDLRGDLYCPECQQALLAVTNRRNSKYIYESQRVLQAAHTSHCSYNLRRATYREMRQYSTQVGVTKINQQLTQLLQKEVAVQASTEETARVIQATHQQLTHWFGSGSQCECKRLLYQRLDELLIYNLETRVPKFYYGRVILCDRRVHGRFINYTVKTLAGRWVCSIGIDCHQAALLAKLDGQLIEQAAVTVDLAFFGTIWQRAGDINGHLISYRDVFLENDNYCVIRAV